MTMDCVTVKEGYRPVLTCPVEEFADETAENNTFAGIPPEFFDVVDGKLLLCSEVASELEWEVKDVVSDNFIVQVKTDTVVANGTEKQLDKTHLHSVIPRYGLVVES
jgi:hypothetical protein